jgi:aldehyde dehydrogenase (NAD+)
MKLDSEARPPSRYAFGDLYIAGQWRLGSDGEEVAITNPWSAEILAKIVRAGPTDVDEAYSSAANSQEAWANALPGERAKVFRQAGSIMEARQTEIIDWLVKESGSTVSKAGIEWWAVHNSVLEAATLPSRVEGRILYGDYSGKENRIYRRPVGVVGVISPWNWPMHLSMRSIAPALALGNSVVVKPATETPVTGGLMIAKIFEEAGLPPGVLNVVSGDSDKIGDHFTAHDAARVISFTGSTKVGRRVGRIAIESPMIKKAMLELGGNGPLIVTEDVDLETAVHTAVVGKLFHQGQMCIAVNRIIIVDAIHDAFVERFVEQARALPHGDPADPRTAYGPIINRTQLDRLLAMIETAKSEGARLLLGSRANGLILPIHVFDRVEPEMEIARKEIFGPIAPILRARDDEDAIRLANATEYGLTSGVLCRDEGRAMRIAQQIQAGMTHINDIPAIDMPQLPFGGERNSGLGRFGSKGMIEVFTTEHWISVQHTQAEYPF